MLAWEAAWLKRNAGSSRSAAAAALLTISRVRRSSARASSYFPREYIGPLSDWIVFAANRRDSLLTPAPVPAGRDAISFSTISNALRNQVTDCCASPSAWSNQPMRAMARASTR